MAGWRLRESRSARGPISVARVEQQVLLLDHARDHAGPARLVARTDAGAVVTVEVLVEEDQVPPVRVLLELRGAAVGRTMAVAVPHEDADQAAGDLMRDLCQRHQPS